MLHAVGAVLLGLLVAAAPQSQEGTPTAHPLTAEQDTLFADARKDFGAQHYAEALAKFQTLHTQVPGNATFAKFGAEAAVNIADFAAANSLLQPILAETPDDAQALALEAHLYGQQHDVAKRDATLARLQSLHDSGAIKLQSVIVEKDALPGGDSVTIVDFLEPWSRYHIALMATFFDAAGKQKNRIALESDDIDQVSFAKEHPKEAAAGMRMYSTDGYSEQRAPDGHVTAQTHATLCWAPGCFLPGKPTYEFFREHVLGTAGTQNKPISTTTVNTAPAPR